MFVCVCGGGGVWGCVSGWEGRSQLFDLSLCPVQDCLPCQFDHQFARENVAVKYILPFYKIHSLNVHIYLF